MKSNSKKDLLDTVKADLINLISESLQKCRDEPEQIQELIEGSLDRILSPLLFQRTINGKTFKQVMKELEEPFENVTTDYQGHYALSNDMVDTRLKEVLGLNYDFIIQRYELVEVMEVKSIIGYGELIIKDDGGVEVCRRGHGGGTNIIIFKDTEGSNPISVKDVPNDCKIAFIDIKKRCAKEFGIGSFLDKGKPDVKLVPFVPYSDIDNSVDSTNYITFKVLSLPETKSKGIRIEVISEDDRKGVLIIWNNIKKDLGQSVKDNLHNIKVGDTVKACVSEKMFRDELQFTVKSLILDE